MQPDVLAQGRLHWIQLISGLISLPNVLFNCWRSLHSFWHGITAHWFALLSLPVNHFINQACFFNRLLNSWLPCSWLLIRFIYFWLQIWSQKSLEQVKLKPEWRMMAWIEWNWQRKQFKQTKQDWLQPINQM